MASYTEVLSQEEGQLVSVCDACAQLNIIAPDPAEERLISMYIDVATDLIENATWTTLRPTEVRVNWQRTEVTQFERRPFVKIPRYPLQSVSLVEIWDGNSFEPTTQYNVEQKNVAFPRIQFQYDAFADITTSLFNDEQAYFIRATCSVGFATVPSAIKLAILQLVTALYDNRGDCQCDDVTNLLGGVIRSTMSPYIVRDFFG